MTLLLLQCVVTFILVSILFFFLLRIKKKTIYIKEEKFLLYNETWSSTPLENSRILQERDFYRCQVTKQNRINLQKQQWLQANSYCFWNKSGKLFFINALQNINLITINPSILISNLQNSIISIEIELIHNLHEVAKINRMIIERQNRFALQAKTISELKHTIPIYIFTLDQLWITDFMLNYANKWGIFFLTYGSKIMPYRNLIGQQCNIMNARFISPREAIYTDSFIEERIIIC